jgi:hypothetical protein
MARWYALEILVNDELADQEAIEERPSAKMSAP